ncbi:MAG: CIA30 family protein [Leptolyngbyaceae cyanobacterium CRU_2_3]|nr:CIA30 family protein [Leptolyngbyaceae cyanobacterium CRU_2_3]
MSQQNASRWDLCRFVKTLSYFGVVPLLSRLNWFQQWFGSYPDPKVNSALFTPMINDSASTDRLIFDFTQPSDMLPAIWGALDDVVMGGVSQSGIQFGVAGACFSGQVSTANSGGFASVRTRNFEPSLDLSDYTGIELRVKGDGNRYKFMLRAETRWDGIAYCYSFDTVAHAWITVRVAFAALIPVFRAKTVGNSPFAADRITSMQLMLSKFEYDGGLNPHFQPGSFQLQIASIGAYRV